jgi:hypothetical protein
MKMLCAFGALASYALSGGVALAGVEQNVFNFEVETGSWIDVVEGGFVDESYRGDDVYRELDSLFGYDDSGSFIHNTGVDFNGQSALSTNDASYVYGVSGFEMHSTQHSSIELASGLNSGTENQTMLYGGMIFDADTLVDVFVRVDYSGVSGGTLGSYFELEGAVDAPITDFEIEDPIEAGFYEISMQVEVLAGEFFSVYVEGLIALDALDYGAASGSGDLSTSVIVSVVPAPAGAGLFAGLGLIAIRRRRTSGSAR